MTAPLSPGLLLVATREVRWIWRDRVALFLALVVPLFAFALLSLTFSNAVIRDLRVDVVDADRYATSLTYVQAINSAPGVTVAERSTDLTRAMQAIRSGEAIAAVYIPANLERDIVAGKRPQIVSSTTSSISRPATSRPRRFGAISAAPPICRRGGRRGYAPGVLVVEQYVLTNPALNYAQFLLRAILPTVLHVVVAIAAGYAVGSEFGSRSKREWLEAAGGDPLTALVGKLAPYFGIFVLLMVVAALTIHRGYEVPFRGEPCCRGGGMPARRRPISRSARFSVAGAQPRFRPQPDGIVCSPAFGFAGVGFPVLAMGGFAQVWGSFLPLRWYIQILFDQAARGVPPVDSARAVRRPCRPWRWPISASPGFGCASIARKPAPASETIRDRLRHGQASPSPLATEVWTRPARPRRLRSVRAGAASSMACSTRSPISDSWFVPCRSPSSTAIIRSSAATSSRA